MPKFMVFEKVKLFKSGVDFSDFNYRILHCHNIMGHQNGIC